MATRPYRPGLIPVVFVHGTASSAARWAQLFNELDNDPRLFSRYQFWFFSYETGNAIPYSAMLLREALANAVAQLDPEGKDPALRQMVVIGHSQGGLLTKCMVVEPGNSFWANVSDHPLDELGLPAETADLLRRALVTALQRARQRPAHLQPLPVLVLLLRDGQRHRLLRDAAP